MTKLVKMTIRVPAEMAERIKFLAHDTCESASRVAVLLLNTALKKEKPKPGLTVRGIYLPPEILTEIRPLQTLGLKIAVIKVLRAYTSESLATGDIGLHEAKNIADELWTRKEDW